MIDVIGLDFQRAASRTARSGGGAASPPPHRRIFLSFELASKSSAKFSCVVQFRFGPSGAWEPTAGVQQQQRHSTKGDSGLAALPGLDDNNNNNNTDGDGNGGAGAAAAAAAAAAAVPAAAAAAAAASAPAAQMGLEGGGRAVSIRCEFPLAAAGAGVEILHLRLVSEAPIKFLPGNQQVALVGRSGGRLAVRTYIHGMDMDKLCTVQCSCARVPACVLLCARTHARS